MGYRLCWVAVRGKPAARVREQLGVRRTGDRAEIGQKHVVGGAVPSGWYLVVQNDLGPGCLTEDALVARIAADCEVVSCDVEEHGMYSAASGWRDGVRLWSVVHDHDLAVDHLATGGEVPASLPAIHDQIRASLEDMTGQASDSWFDVPVELAKLLIGFRHDEGDETFEVLTADDSSDLARREWFTKFANRR